MLPLKLQTNFNVLYFHKKYLHTCRDWLRHGYSCFFSLLPEDWGLVVLIPFISPPLSVIQSSLGTQVTHTLQWARSTGEIDDTLEEFKKRGTNSETVIRWRNKRVVWWWKRSYTFMMRLMDWLNLLSSNARWINTEYTEKTNNWLDFWHCIQLKLIFWSSPHTLTLRAGSTSIFVVSFSKLHLIQEMCCRGYSRKWRSISNLIVCC